MRVLYLSYDGMTDPLGQSQVLPYLTGLAVKGVSITLISCEKPDRFDAGKKIIEDICAKSNITWLPIPYTKRPPILSTIKDVRRMRRVALFQHAKTPFDIVHCRSYIAALTGAYLKRRLGVKFLFDMRGFWADERVDGKVWSLSSPIFKRVYQFFKRKEKMFLQTADAVVSLTHNAVPALDEIAEKKVPVTVIPCCANLNHFDYNRLDGSQRTKARQILGIGEGDLALCYLGSIGTWYMADEMMQFYRRLMLKYPVSKFLLITTDAKDEILSLATKYDIDPDRLIIRSAKRDEVPLFLSACDLSVFFILPVFSKRASSPTKHGELMGMGLPVVCNTGVGDVDQIMRDYPAAGLVIHDMTDAGFDKAIEALPELLCRPKEDIRKAAIGFYDLADGTEKYYGIYCNLTQQ